MADDELTGLFSESIYCRFLSFLKGGCEAETVTQVLLEAGLSRATSYNYVTGARECFQVCLSTTDVSEIIVERESGREIVPDHLVEQRVGTALSVLEYDATFDAAKASIADLSKKVCFLEMIRKHAG